jgi:hypothetical protein
MAVTVANCWEQGGGNSDGVCEKNLRRKSTGIMIELWYGALGDIFMPV